MQIDSKSILSRNCSRPRDLSQVVVSEMAFSGT